MGFLKKLYELIKTEFDTNKTRLQAQGQSGAPTEIVRRELTDEIFLLERALLMNPKQLSEFDLTKSRELYRDAPFDELEFIVKNDLVSGQYVANARECVLDLYEISTVENENESEKYRGDDLAKATLNLLHRQAAQVLLLSGDDDNGRLAWLTKQPESFVQAALIEEGKPADAFDKVGYDEDLSALDIDYNEFLHKTSSEYRKNAEYAADKAFNKQATRQKRLIKKWEKKLFSAKGEYRMECEYQKSRAEKNLSRATEARREALADAFRLGEISEYYYRQRTEQLSSGDYSRLPGLFEADDLKNRSAYLKKHDLQDLSKAEADNILLLAKRRASEDKRVFFTKKFLSERKISSATRFTISEMKIDTELFYRGFSEGGELAGGVVEEIEEEPTKITIDVSEPLPKGDGSFALGGIKYVEPFDRRIDK